MSGKPARLTPRQQAFVERYAACGNATEAARLAGYAEQYAGRFAAQLLEKPLVREALAALTKHVSSARIADAKERQEFWTSMMRDEMQETKDRLKASELLAKKQGDFIERHEVNNTTPPNIQVQIVHVKPATDCPSI